ncbi:hypothetical protein MNBD_GAMMA05-1133 [hydrothermal vent metagenome]|uniref:Uncharacterized protein n=1 Tax=hydrothermal vent metagenome TaxID=652676 RepID=A0A3B0WB84_9ZZZZ
MLYLKQSIKAWDTDSFKDVLIKELRSIDASLLPLQQGLSYSNFAVGDNISAIILCTEDNNGQLQVKAGLFYSGIIAGCNCADDPTPVDEINEYCEVLLAIDKKTALTTVSLIK